jgi:RNA polymerase sigma-70 factor, ECF subfamily
MPSPGLSALEDVDDVALASMIEQDFDAFTELYRRHSADVFRFVRMQVRDDAAAEDVTAQTFFRAWSSATSFRGEGSYKGWLIQIAHNTLADWYSKEAHALPTEEPPETVDPDPTPPAQVIRLEERNEVHQVVAKLPVEQRRAVVLRYLLEVPIIEIAKLMGRTEGAVRILLHRARLRMRRLVERERREKS